MMLQSLIWCNTCQKQVHTCRKSSDCGGERAGARGRGVGARGAELEERLTLERAEPGAGDEKRRGRDQGAAGGGGS